MMEVSSYSLCSLGWTRPYTCPVVSVPDGRPRCPSARRVHCSLNVGASSVHATNHDPCPVRDGATSVVSVGGRGAKSSSLGPAPELAGPSPELMIGGDIASAVSRVDLRWRADGARHQRSERCS